MNDASICAIVPSGELSRDEGEDSYLAALLFGSGGKLKEPVLGRRAMSRQQRKEQKRKRKRKTRVGVAKKLLHGCGRRLACFRG